MTFYPKCKKTIRWRIIASLVCLLSLVILQSAYGEQPAKSMVDERHGLGYVVVSPNGPKDGGDFGANTPGTQTSGLQEAFDYAKAHGRDVYIAGGGMTEIFKPPRGHYVLKKTLKIPWMQDFRLDGGESLIAYQGPPGDAIVIDSQMNCRYKFGLVYNGTGGAVVRLKPESKGPDTVTGIVCSTFDFNVVCGGGSVYPGKGLKGKGLGLVLDTSSGPIACNSLSVMELIACDKGLYLMQGCSNNWVKVTYLHLCNTHLQVGDEKDASTQANRIEAHIDGEKIEGSIGARIFGQRNRLILNVHRTAPGKNIVFEPEASDNYIETMTMPDGITNNASLPTNTIVSATARGFDDVVTPPFPKSGENVVNRNPFPVQILILTAGKVSDWALLDARGASRNILGSLFAGQQISLGPGQQVRFNYTEPPSWTWTVLQ